MNQKKRTKNFVFMRFCSSLSLLILYQYLSFHFSSLALMLKIMELLVSTTLEHGESQL